jgi:hypothetical protein
MISVDMSRAGDPLATQRTPSPVVYFDHWALRQISDSTDQATAFIDLLKSRGGTFALSWVNLVEFARLTDERQIRRAEDFVDKLIPQVAFLEADPDVVIAREDSARRPSGLPLPPHIDAEMVRCLLNPEPNSLRVFSARRLLTQAAQPAIKSAVEGLSQRVALHVEERRRSYTRQLSIHALLQRYSHDLSLQSPTRIIRDFLISSFFADKRKQIGPNDVIDFLHSVVPLAYCDVALLDSHWRDKADRLQRSLPQRFPIACCLSRRGGIDQLLSKLERM